MSTNISTKTIVQDDGITVLSNDTINFTGSGVTVTNVGGAAQVYIPAPPTGLNYKGLWDATLNSPTLTSSVGTLGDFYIVSVAGTTNLNGVTDWQVSDWAIFEGGVWQKIDNHDIQAYNTVKDESTILPQRSVLKFTGDGVTASDAGGETVVTIPIQPAYSTIKDEGSSLTQRSTINFIGGGVTASDVGGETIVTIPGNIPTANYGLYAQTANSVPVTATIVESSLIGSGVGTLSVPANSFSVGASFSAKLFGHISCVGSATIQIRIKSGSIILADTGIVALDTTTNKHWMVDVNFTIRSLGGAGVGSIASGGLFSYIKNSGLNFEGENFSIVNNTTFNTTILNTLDITAQWNTNNAGNSIYSEIFTLSKTY